MLLLHGRIPVIIGRVRFERNCRKMYSRHLFPYGALVRRIAPQPGIIWQSPQHLIFEIFPPLTEKTPREWAIKYLFSVWYSNLSTTKQSLGLSLFADVAVRAAVDWFCAILFNSFHKNSARKVTLNRFFYLSGRSCLLWHKNCKNLRKGDCRCHRK